MHKNMFDEEIKDEEAKKYIKEVILGIQKEQKNIVRGMKLIFQKLIVKCYQKCAKV